MDELTQNRVFWRTLVLAVWIFSFNFRTVDYWNHLWDICASNMTVLKYISEKKTVKVNGLSWLMVESQVSDKDSGFIKAGNLLSELIVDCGTATHGFCSSQVPTRLSFIRPFLQLSFPSSIRYFLLSSFSLPPFGSARHDSLLFHKCDGSWHTSGFWLSQWSMKTLNAACLYLEHRQNGSKRCRGHCPPSRSVQATE